jgi:inosine-uridine nucleoside N-ribohydrolase
VRNVLIDTDTASDDAVALIMALRSPSIRVSAITVVAGNVPVTQGAHNALYTVELCGSETPVFAGAERPLRRSLQIADWFHGRDGLSNHGYAPERRHVEATHAVDAIVDTIRAHPGIEIVTLGPLTNLALALAREPGLTANVSRCVVMGGAPCCEGNVTPAAEYNIWVDPEAARAVFRSGLAVELIGWQLCRGEAMINQAEIGYIESLGTSYGNFAIGSNSTAIASILRQTGEVGISLPDPVAMGVLLNPALSLRESRHFVEVETESELTRGMTVVDRLNVAQDIRNREVWSEAIRCGQPATVCWKLDVVRWKRLLFDSLR